MMKLPLAERRAVLAAAAAFLSSPAWADAPPEPPIITEHTPPVPGPKRTIGVGAIDVVGTFANASATNAGGPVAAMLTTALDESGCCRVVERDAIAQMVTEMDLAKSHVSAGTAAPMPGAALPAQYLVVGSMTGQSAGDRGGGLSIGGSNAAVTLGGSQGSVQLDLRMIDTRTGAVVKTIKVRRNINSSNVGFTGAAAGIPIGANGFGATPLGEAVRHAMNDAVIQIARTLAAMPWRGQVVKFENGIVWANVGAEGGIHAGDQLSVERVGETLTDPATGEVLSQSSVELGMVTISDVQPRIAWGAYRAAKPGDPARGDFLVLQPR